MADEQGDARQGEAGEAGAREHVAGAAHDAEEQDGQQQAQETPGHLLGRIGRGGGPDFRRRGGTWGCAGACCGRGLQDERRREGQRHQYEGLPERGQMLADEQGGDGDGRGHDGGQSDDAGEVVLGEGEGCQAVETVQGPAEQAARPAAGEDDGGARGEEGGQHEACRSDEQGVGRRRERLEVPLGHGDERHGRDHAARQHQRDGREDARAAERFCARIGQ